MVHALFVLALFQAQNMTGGASPDPFSPTASFEVRKKAAEAYVGDAIRLMEERLGKLPETPAYRQERQRLTQDLGRCHRLLEEINQPGKGMVVAAVLQTVKTEANQKAVREMARKVVAAMTREIRNVWRLLSKAVMPSAPEPPKVVTKLSKSAGIGAAVAGSALKLLQNATAANRVPKLGLKDQKLVRRPE